MLTGYNTDFKFQGKIYHVQTEDCGTNNPQIVSLLYHQGEILASRKTSYQDILKADCLDEVVREIMMEQHKKMIRDLMNNNLGDIKGQPPSIPPKQEVKKPEPVAAKSKPVEEIKEKSLDDIILDFLAQEQKEREKGS